MNYVRKARLVAKRIRKFGTRCVLRIPSGEEEYNPETGEYESDEAEYEGFCVVTLYQADAIDGTVIRATDKKLLCVLPVEPRPSVGVIDVYNKVTSSADTYTVGLVEKIAPDNTTVIAYKVQGKR